MSQYSSSHRRSVIDSPIPPVGAPGCVAYRRRAGRMVTQAIDADRLRPMIESAIRAVHTVINAPGPALLAGGGRRSTGSDSAAENETTRSRGAGAPRGRVGWSPTDAKSPIGRPGTVTHTTLGTGAMSAPKCDLPRRRSDWSLRAPARWAWTRSSSRHGRCFGRRERNLPIRPPERADHTDRGERQPARRPVGGRPCRFTPAARFQANPAEVGGTVLGAAVHPRALAAGDDLVDVGLGHGWSGQWFA